MNAGRITRTHRILVILVLPTSIASLLLGCRRHQDRSVLLLGAAGLAGLVVTAGVGHVLFGELGERLATIAAGFSMALAHMRNFRLCRTHACNHE
jgi:hypothetical protein